MRGDEAVQILGLIIDMAQRTKEALESHEVFSQVYVIAVGENLENAYREMSIASIPKDKNDNR